MMNLETSFQHKRFWIVPNTAPDTQPVRYTKEDIVLVYIRTIGASNDPDGSEIVVGIKTDYYVSFRTKRLESGKRYYDLLNAHLVTKEGKPLQGDLPVPVRNLLNEVWGAQALPRNTPKKNYG